MSRFYGYVCDEQGGRGEATRCGHKGITTAAQSYAGSVIVDLSGDGDAPTVTVSIASGSSHHGDRVWTGTIAELEVLLLEASYKERS